MPRIPMMFVGPVTLTDAAVEHFEVPAGERYVIRHIHVSNPSGAAVGFTASIGVDAAGTRIFDDFSVAAAAEGETESVKDFWGAWVLEAGDTFEAYAGTDATLVMTVAGERHTL